MEVCRRVVIPTCADGIRSFCCHCPGRRPVQFTSSRDRQDHVKRTERRRTVPNGLCINYIVMVMLADDFLQDMDQVLIIKHMKRQIYVDMVMKMRCQFATCLSVHNNNGQCFKNSKVAKVRNPYRSSVGHCSIQTIEREFLFKTIKDFERDSTQSESLKIALFTSTSIRLGEASIQLLSGKYCIQDVFRTKKSLSDHDVCMLQQGLATQFCLSK